MIPRLPYPFAHEQPNEQPKIALFEQKGGALCPDIQLPFAPNVSNLNAIQTFSKPQPNSVLRRTIMTTETNFQVTGVDSTAFIDSIFAELEAEANGLLPEPEIIIKEVPPIKSEQPVIAAEEKAIAIPITMIDPFPSHPFQVRDDEEMAKLVESVKEYGVLTPAVARAKDGGRYELISGHRRKHACEIAGIETMPVIVRDMTREQAVVAMADSNLQRERVLASEKAFAYKMKLDALKKQGRRADLTSTPVARKLPRIESAELVGAASGDSKDTVRRYIRLTNLIPPLLKMVDDGVIAFRQAVEISYLTKQAQKDLLAAMNAEVCTPSHAQAIKLKAFAQEGKLTPEVIASIMQEQKPNQVEKLKIPRETLAKYFGKDETPEAMTQTIIKALELYRKRERSRDDAR
jgi:ParB family chromosome partitioning protein